MEPDGLTAKKNEGVYTKLLTLPPLGAALVKEMTDMQVKTTLAGGQQYAAWREGQHDDLVLAVALACWGGKEGVSGRPEGDDRWWTSPMRV